MVLFRRAEPEALLSVGFEERWVHYQRQNQQVDVIFILCLVLYVIISALWAGYWVLSRHAGVAAGKTYMLVVILSWGMTSVCLHILNKAVVERTQAPATIASVQMAIAVAIMVPLASYDLFQVKPKQLLYWLVVPLVFGGAVCTSSFTYEYMSLSLYAIVRNLAPLVVMPIEKVLMDEAKAPRITVMVCAALLMMVAGALLYVGGLHGFSWTGIYFAILNVVLAVIDRFLQRRLLTEECKELPTKVCTLVNNAVGIIPCILVSCLKHELGDARHVHSAVWTHPHNIFLILLSGIAGLVICYLGFECQRVLSVTSFYVMQNVSRVFLVVVGVLCFGDPLRSARPVTGLILSLLGSALYGNIQLQSQASNMNTGAVKQG